MPFGMETRGLGAGSYPEPPLEPDRPRCPVCRRECAEVMRDRHGDVLGCDECLSTESAWEASECFEEGEHGEL